MPTGKPITPEFEKLVSEYYKSSVMTVQQCANRFGLSMPTVIKILDRQNVQRYKKAIVYNPNLNERYFQIIDTEAKAYFLGMIIADGNVFINLADGNGRQTSVSITVNEYDSYILSKFLEEIGASTKIGHDGRGATTAAVRSDLMGLDLTRYGVVPGKSFDTYLPHIPEEMYRHLIRGIFDGDGSIQAKPNKGKYMHALSFCGTHDLMYQISDKVHAQTGAKRINVYDYKTRQLSEIKYQAIDDMYKIGTWMYKDATIFLKRKQEVFTRFLEHYNL